MAPLPRARDRSRPHDIVLWGATGFTGRLLAEYLVRTRADGDLRLALGGRNRSKLEALRATLADIEPAAGELPVLLGDSFDAASLDAIASSAEVVCSTVGPYIEYGAELVAACVRNGTDYCDLTGEVPFIRQTIDRHHAAAQETGARIVHSCGFDSIPSDLGTLMMQEAMRERHGIPCDAVKLFAGESRGGVGGGTVASLLNLLEKARKDRSIRRLLADPYALNPEGEREGPDGPGQKGTRFDEDLGMWTGPFVMASVNTRVVRRSNALLGYRYGRAFRYAEAMSFGRGPRGFLMANAVTGFVLAFAAAATLPVTRALLQRTVLPAPGEGPDAEARERGFFVMRLIGKAQTREGEPVLLRGRVEGRRDPGYAGTAVMLGESARSLAVDGAALDCPGGVRTPASCMGMTLVERLREADMVFRVE